MGFPGDGDGSGCLMIGFGRWFCSADDDERKHKYVKVRRRRAVCWIIAAISC